MKKGGIAAALLDQNVDWYDGEWVDFFGRPACTNKGLALLARATGTPVVPYYSFRAPDGKLDICFEPEIPLVKTGDKTMDTWHNTQNYTKALENIIRRHPEQWFWLHQRWKDQTLPRLAPAEMTMKPLDPAKPRRILVRATNWVGDAVMTLPALEALAKACPGAELQVLAKPWVEAVYRGQPGVSRVLVYDAKGVHQGLSGRLRLARQVRGLGFDWAVLFQNAFDAAFLARLAGIPVRLGYATDGRELLLSHGVAKTPEVRNIHETAYYLNILHGAGVIKDPPRREGVTPRLVLGEADENWALEFLARNGLGRGARLMGLAPGAAFGPAKMWPAGRFARAAELLRPQGFEAVLLFGSKAEAEACRRVEEGLSDMRTVNLAGQTSLGQALALLGQLGLFITNDSGLMHAAAALGVATCAVFGSTNPVTTSPLGPRTMIVRKPVKCSPCLKPVCPKPEMICFAAITPEDVATAALELLGKD